MMGDRKAILRFLLRPIWLALYVPVVLHELGHYVIGLLLGFPVQGIEIGSFPRRVIKIHKLILRIGRFPRGGKTLLGFGTRTYSRLQQFCFILGGLAFEFLFFGCLLYLTRKHVLFELLVFVFYLDQLAANFFPKYEEGRAVNDGGSLLELLFPKKALKNQLKIEP